MMFLNLAIFNLCTVVRVFTLVSEIKVLGGAQVHPEHGGPVHLAGPSVHLSGPGLDGWGAHGHEVVGSDAPGPFHLEHHPLKV